MEIEEGISKHVLQDKLDLIKSSIAKSHWWAYRIEGMQNFIYHLDSFSSERIRNKIANEIFEYLRHAEEKINLNQEPGPSMMELFPVFNPISRIYEDELGFIIKPDWFIFILGVVVLFLILNYFFATMLALIAVLAIGLTKVVYTQIKTKRKKVY